jgi:hypothetical protein
MESVGYLRTGYQRRPKGLPLMARQADRPDCQATRRGETADQPTRRAKRRGKTANQLARRTNTTEQPSEVGCRSTCLSSNPAKRGYRPTCLPNNLVRRGCRPTCLPSNPIRRSALRQTPLLKRRVEPVLLSHDNTMGHIITKPCLNHGSSTKGSLSRTTSDTYPR